MLPMLFVLIHGYYTTLLLMAHLFPSPSGLAWVLLDPPVLDRTSPWAFPFFLTMVPALRVEHQTTTSSITGALAASKGYDGFDAPPEAWNGGFRCRVWGLKGCGF